MRNDLSKAVHIAAGKSNDMKIFDFLFSSYSDIIDVNYQSEKVSVIKLYYEICPLSKCMEFCVLWQLGWTILHEIVKFDGGGRTARSKDPKPLNLLLAHPNIDINRQDTVRITP